MSFATRLKTLRAEHHMTQKELASRMNLARTTITGYETKNRQPSHEKLADMASIFGVTVHYLLEDTDNPLLSSSVLQTQHERLLDDKVMKLYRQLSLHSKEETLRYLQLLELWEKNQD